eukprot:jgi/Tetstr1/430024/TSEL_019885.t1
MSLAALTRSQPAVPAPAAASCRHTRSSVLPASRPLLGNKRAVRRTAAQPVAALAPQAVDVAVRPVFDLAAAAAAEAAPSTLIPGVSNAVLAWAAGVAIFVAVVLAIKKVFDTPSRAYEENVGDEYDQWTEEGVLEYYWGEHIHLGHYSEAERAAGYKKKDFIQAKYDFIDEMLDWSGAKEPKTIVDVGCGIGGTTRRLAARFPDAEVIGITLSPSQVKRATELAKERGLTNVTFKVMNALEMEFEAGSFDLVWACESGEHMPDKKKYVEEMTRVLAPGGTLAVATWCQREETPDTPFTEEDKVNLNFLYEEWAHPYFVSKEEYGRIMEGTGALESVVADDWTPQTIDSWRHSIWVGVWDPWIVVFKGPKIWYRTLREIVTLERMHRAFDRGLMEYGMIKSVKPLAQKTNSPVAQASELQA